MDTREEIYNKLLQARMIVNNLMGADYELQRVRSYYKPIIPPKKVGGFSVTVLVFMGIGFLYQLASQPIHWNTLIYIVAFAVVGILMKIYYKQKNNKIVEENVKSVEHNKAIAQQEQVVLNDIANIQNAYSANVRPWFPDKYCYLEAIDAFLAYFNNRQADTLKEAINQYETDLFRNRMEENQRRSIQQQKMNNLLTMGTIAMQGVSIVNQNRNATRIQGQIQQASRQQEVNNARIQEKLDKIID